MILYINTTEGHELEVSLQDKGSVIINKKFSAAYAQAEKLLPSIDVMLKKRGLNLKDIKTIKVENRGGSFTSLRIGVITANALGYAMGAKVIGSVNKNKGKVFDIIEPVYSGEPNITQKKTG